MSVHPLSDALQEPAELVRELLLRPAPPAQLVGRALACGLPIDRPVRAFRARPLHGSPDAIAPSLRRHTASDWIGLVDLDGDVAGLTTGSPCVGVSLAIVGLGPPVPLTRVHGSFVAASRALDAAWSTGRKGTHRLGDVALAAAVVADEDVGVALEARYLAQLDAAGPQSEVLAETLRTYLASDLHVGRAAAMLGLHPNSLRYRLRQFEELTGTDLRSFEDAMCVWWALEWRRRRGATLDLA